ncbi:hypothetical protein QQF64_026035 [Cirrhinus molitorella]|uniref:Transposase n=1 Tax=Cirrhinus molitorella TaxID=172907 RepID=A0ABR3NQP3_9TELE
MEQDECINEFRVRKCDIPILADVLRIPNEIICDQRSVVGGVEALCMLLKRLTYPCRYSDMMQRFGHRQVPVLCMATNSMLDYIYDVHHQRITQWNDNILNPAALETYADYIHQKGAPLENCFGFIDGTVRPIARPGITQRILYNGHKRIHSLKYQAVAIPNGLIAHLYGPEFPKGSELRKHKVNSLKRQFAIFVRFVSEDCTVKEELLDVLPLKDRTRGIDLKETLMNVVEKADLQLSKLTAITTDGAPAMLGSEKGLVGLCKSDERFPEFWTFHCIVHQEHLVSKKLNLDHIMKPVLEIVYFIRTHALNHRQFRNLIAELNEDLPSDLCFFTVL